jgi:hypothetical protein
MSPKMRLNALRQLVFDSKFIVPTINNNIISNYVELRDSVIRLEKIPFFNNEIVRLKKFGGLFIDSNLSFVLFGDPINEFRDALFAYKSKIELVIDLLNYLIREEEDNTIVIKAPDSSEFSEHINFLDSTYISISQIVINDKINGKVELTRYEIGSSWIIVGLGSLLAIQVVASAFWAAAVIRKKWYESEIIKQQVEAIKIKNDAQKALLDGLEKDIQLSIELEAKNIVDQYDLDKGPEYLERMKMSIKMQAELIKNGTVIYPELIRSETANTLFPDLVNLRNIESRVKQITSSN